MPHVNVSATHTDPDNNTYRSTTQVWDTRPGNNIIKLGCGGCVSDRQVLNNDHDNYVACSPVDVYVENTVCAGSESMSYTSCVGSTGIV